MANRTLVSVKPASRSNFRYGFYTTTDGAEQTALGQVVVVGGLASGVVFGANSPKPARMRKLRDSGRSANSYVDSANRTTAAQAGWKLTKKARARGVRASALSKPVYIKLKVGTGQTAVTIQYAWMMPTETYTAISADMAALGIKDVSATEDRFDLVFGSSPKPPRAFKKATGLSTFCDPDATIPAGWSLTGGETE